MALPCHRKLQHTFLLALAIALLAAPAVRAQSGGVRPAVYDDSASRARAQLLSQAQQSGVAQASYSQTVPAGYVPAHQRGQGRPTSARAMQGRMVSQEEIHGEEMPYDMQYEGEYFEGEMYGDGYGHPGGGDCGCGGGGCGDCCGGGCGQSCCPPMKCMPMCCIPVPCFSMENFTAAVGVEAFKGPLNHGYDGSFGFSYGFNWGGPMLFASKYGLGMQVGAKAIHSDLSGSAFTTDDREQLFVTAGFFRRVDCGLQGGIVWDYMNQEWGDELSMSQFRAEASWLNRCGGEWGFLATWSDREDEWVTNQNVNGNTTAAPFATSYTVDTTDYYAGFYRKQFRDCNGGEGRFLAGFTQYGDGFVGADMTVPINCNWALQGNFAYIIPDGDRNADGRYDDESWNVGVALVWYPCHNARGSCGCGSYYRPFFRVADNGIMHFDTRANDD